MRLRLMALMGLLAASVASVLLALSGGGEAPPAFGISSFPPGSGTSIPAGGAAGQSLVRRGTTELEWKTITGGSGPFAESTLTRGSEGKLAPAGGSAGECVARKGATTELEYHSCATAAELALKANLVSPSFTGTPLGPTAAEATNTSQLASTAFVHTVANAAQTAAEAAAVVESRLTRGSEGKLVVSGGSAGECLKRKATVELEWASCGAGAGEEPKEQSVNATTATTKISLAAGATIHVTLTAASTEIVLESAPAHPTGVNLFWAEPGGEGGHTFTIKGVKWLGGVTPGFNTTPAAEVGLVRMSVPSSAPTEPTGWVPPQKNSIVDEMIGPGAVHESSLASPSVGASKIVGGAVGTSALAALGVTEAKIAEGAVTETKLGTGAVTAGKLGSEAVETAKIKGSAVTAAKLATDAVETAKIKSEAVTEAKLASEAVTAGKLATDAVESAKIKSEAVTSAKIASEAITAAKIAEGVITAVKLASEAVTAAKLGAEAVTTAALKSEAVTAAKIGSEAVTEPKLKQGSEGKLVPTGGSAKECLKRKGTTESEWSTCPKIAAPTALGAYTNNKEETETVATYVTCVLNMNNVAKSGSMEATVEGVGMVVLQINGNTTTSDHLPFSFFVKPSGKWKCNGTGEGFLSVTVTRTTLE